MRAKRHVFETRPVRASALRQHGADASTDLSEGATANVVNDSGMADLNPAPGLSTHIGALSGTNFNQSFNSFIGGTVGAGQSFRYSTYVNANSVVNATQTQISQSLSESLGCPHDHGPDSNWPNVVESSGETPEYKMPNCSRCGGRLRRIHRSFFQRLLYDKVYRCQVCLKREGH